MRGSAPPAAPRAHGCQGFQTQSGGVRVELPPHIIELPSSRSHSCRGIDPPRPHGGGSDRIHRAGGRGTHAGARDAAMDLSSRFSSLCSSRSGGASGARFRRVPQRNGTLQPGGFEPPGHPNGLPPAYLGSAIPLTGRSAPAVARQPRIPATVSHSCCTPSTMKVIAQTPRAMFVWSLFAHSSGIRLPLRRPSNVTARKGMNSEPRTP